MPNFICVKVCFRALYAIGVYCGKHGQVLRKGDGMYSIRTLAVVLAFLGSSGAYAGDCLPSTHKDNNCLFSIPPLKDGLAAVVDADASSLFTGAVAVACNDGNLTLGKSTCQVSDPSNCAVPQATWFGDAKQSCGHDAMLEPLLNGKELTISSTSDVGSITYACDAGKLITKSAVCGVVGEKVGVISAGVAAEPSAAVGAVNAMVSSQAVNTKSYLFDLYFSVNKTDSSDATKVQAAARSQCGKIKGYDAARGAAGIKTSLYTTSTTIYTYQAECPVTITATCDQDYIMETNVSGDYNQKVGEFVDPPIARMRKVCAANGYPDYLDTAYLELTWMPIIDDFTGIMFCGGSSAACATQPPSVNPTIVSALSCTEANVKADAVAVTAGGSLTLSAVQTQVCGPLKFSSAQSITASSKVSSGSTADYYSVSAVCGGYTATAPLKSDCSSNSCIGGLLPTGSTLPYTEIDGKRYQNLCEEPGTPPSNLCASCQSGNFTFLDPANGNSCTLLAPTMVSGKTQNVGFADATVNGNVDLSCNNGSRSVANNGTSKCYRSCPSNARISWGGSGGASCSQLTPAGTYVNGQNLSLTASTGGAGTANLQCNGDNGTWTIKSATCAMGCSGAISWGADNACSATIPSVQNGATGTISSTASGVGSTSYRCNNGTVEMYSSSCSVSCPQATQSWGTVCTNNTPVTANGQSVVISHSTTLATTTAGKTASGTATFSCSNGVMTLQSGSCKYKVSERVGPWSNWVNVGATTCTEFTPDASTVSAGTTFTQTKTCSTNQERTQTTYTVWSDGTETVLSVAKEPRTVSNTETNIATGMSGATNEPFKNVRVGCWVDTVRYDVFGESPCYGQVYGKPKDGMFVAYSVGDTIDAKRERVAFSDPSKWSTTWSGACTGTDNTCGAVKGGTYFKVTLKLKYIPTGETRTYEVTAGGCYLFDNNGYGKQCEL